MYAFSKTKRKRDLLLVSVVLAVTAAVLVGFFLVLHMEVRRTDPNEQPGTPAATDRLRGYASYEAPDVCKVSLCCEPVLENGEVYLYLTSSADNTVLLRAELYSVKVVQDPQTGQATFLPDELLGKTGFIHPGTYVEKVRVRGVEAGQQTKVMVKISALQEESDQSAGIFYIRTTIP